jgi:cytochrome c-type biogenesis protein CcmH/NrfG
MAAPATVMRCLTAETARKRTAGAGSHREEQRVDATRDLIGEVSQELEEGSGGGDESRQQRTEQKEGDGVREDGR